MPTKTYPQAVALAALHAELQAALPALVTVDAAGRRSVQYTLEPLTSPAAVRITVPDSVALSSVDAVLAAHNAATVTAGEQQATDDAKTLTDLAALYSSALVQIGNDRTQIASGVTSLADAAWLPLTALQKADRNRQVLQGILAVLDNGCARELATLKAIRTLMKRAGV